jgi:DNA methylase
MNDPGNPVITTVYQPVSTSPENTSAGYAESVFSGPGDGSVEVDFIRVRGRDIPRYFAEFWTSAQRKASSIHEISYRACFKPQLAAFFIERLTSIGDRVYDPFGGRGTTAIEAGLLGRKVATNDINPLSVLLTRPRFLVPSVDEVTKRLENIPRTADDSGSIDISMFYHPDTMKEILALRDYLTRRQESGREDPVDAWIRMVATNRLTGHSPGFFSVYTLPPNQAVSAISQAKINAKRKQIPPYRDTHKLIIRKTRSLTRNLSTSQKENLMSAYNSGMFLSDDAAVTPEIPDSSVRLTVTSPPFLNIVQYSKDNWLRCWFNRIDDGEVGNKITMTTSLDAWTAMVSRVFRELHRVTIPGGWVAFEVGEVRKGSLRLDEHVIPAGEQAGFQCGAILINKQKFTKTSNIWGIGNNQSGTNTNRIVLFQK